MTSNPGDIEIRQADFHNATLAAAMAAIDAVAALCKELRDILPEGGKDRVMQAVFDRFAIFTLPDDVSKTFESDIRKHFQDKRD